MAITENDLYCQIHDDHRSWSQPKATHEADWDEDGELLLVCLRHAREVRKTGHTVKPLTQVRRAEIVAEEKARALREFRTKTSKRPLTEAAHVALIEASDREHLVVTSFGASGVRLLDEPSNDWAFEYLAELAGVTA